MTFEEVMNKLEELGTAQNRKIYTNHGNDIDMFGVSIENLKKVLKPIKKDKELGLKLLQSKNSDAIYLSQWIGDSDMLTISDLEEIIDLTNFYMTLDNVVPNIAMKNKDLAKECLFSWIDSDNPRKRQSAFGIYSLMLMKYPNDELNQEDILHRLQHIEKVIHEEENRVRYSMNSFVISAGISIPDLTNYCIELSNRIGKVHVSMGKTSCKVPYEYSVMTIDDKLVAIDLDNELAVISLETFNNYSFYPHGELISVEKALLFIFFVIKRKNIFSL